MCQSHVTNTYSERLEKAFIAKLKEDDISSKSIPTEEKKKGWNVLKESYLGKPTLKDWDQMDLEDDDEE